MYRWSKIRVKLEKEYLAPSLRGRIQYFAVSYSKSPDHIGRAAVKLDGREILKSSYWLAYSAFDDAFAELRSDNVCSGENDLWHMACKCAIDKGGFDQLMFYRAFDEFDNQSIEKSLDSENPLVRMFAVLDRRTGKRRLEKLAERIQNEPPWLRQFYYIRFNAENLTKYQNVQQF
ncbi:MAG: hypothetical protein ACI4J6_08965 [Oscillospiraceae bacterium]